MAETAAPASQPSSRSGNAAFIFILVMVAFDMVAFGIIAPVLPDLIRQFEGGDFARARESICRERRTILPRCYCSRVCSWLFT